MHCRGAHTRSHTGEHRRGSATAPRRSIGQLLLLLAVVVGSVLSIDSLLPGAVASQVGAGVAEVIYVAPDGDDHASGATPSSALASCAAAVKIIQERCDSDRGLSSGGIEVQFSAGRYALDSGTACGMLTCRATVEAPIVLRSAGNGEVVFDGSRRLMRPGHKMQPVTNATVRSLLNPAVINDVQVLPVETASGWTGIGQVLQWGDRPLTPSVWPNSGLGYIKKIWDSGAIYCPGRTKGPVPVCQICTGDERSSPAKPCGANFSLTEAPTGDWERELLAGPGFGGEQVTLDGYIGADWFHETHTIARVVRADDSNRTTSVQLGDSSHYGVCEAMEGKGPGCSGGDEGGAPGRFHVHGLLSNVDRPGEYFFDRVARMLYLVPPKEKGELGFWAGPGLITIVNSSHITVRDLVVSGSASSTGALEVIGGDNNTIGGCTVRSCATGIALRGGHRNTAMGNDVFDMTGYHITTSSNENETLENSQNELVPTNNLVSNNHFTQIYLATTTWAVHAGGVGDRFSHNLIHDAPGQVILAGGPLTMWDHK
jgi:parallel beta-helix repeat protein